jgi:RAB6A-GEF complex partner protein 2
MPSDIHVLVRFKEPCVFAGEDINCTITFRNVADVQETPRSALYMRRRSRQGSISQLVINARAAGLGRGLQNPRLLTVAGTNGKSSTGGKHKATMSLSMPSEFNASVHGSREESPAGGPRPVHRLQRSVSIMSTGTPSVTTPTDAIPVRPRRPSTGSHKRSSTIQIVPGSATSPAITTFAGRHDQSPTFLLFTDSLNQRPPRIVKVSCARAQVVRHPAPLDFKSPVEMVDEVRCHLRPLKLLRPAASLPRISDSQ